MQIPSRELERKALS
ncbi:Protein of unknown function [Pyronema omphalodes CBS 100304]|uniref:Uncharacterized protein n=1 Tax=Pyronema omphalodes (strain CBS 100304) TaxID=1076935 RepID=U4KWV0_PYROM|nr:Protein of unknown function [Pyronema omphalodes CBS 100304]